MVYYFTAKVSQGSNEYSDFALDEETTDATIYMGRDKVENDPLIKHSHPKNIWFHVDKVSSAHIYLQLTKDQIKSFKSFEKFLNNVTIIYTPVENLHTDGSMDIGTVTFKNPKLVKRVTVAKKENAIINKLNKTKREVSTQEFIASQEELIREIAMERKQEEREAKELSKQYEVQKKNKADPYANLFAAGDNQVQSNINYVEDDFM
ncbi:Coiled-coil domain-containing protein 25 [Candida viswanathii]|uniref:Coiled-coil domain-containing protein 25 n=1 Tax=Candida viswanathii TaxID=5486 RepID=A0A367XWH6_9ASCO|nr:Coiled-coil domain-containing protein 25 [Candida viswanathii]